MAYVEDGLRARLLEITAVTAITSTIRVATLHETDKLPAILLVLDSESRDTNLDGDGGLTHLSCTAWAVSTDWEEARELAEAMRGTNGSGLEAYDDVAGGIEFHVESIPGRVFESQPLAEGSAEYWHAVGLTLRIGYSEDV